jgi:hypothetical protein
MGEFLSRLGSWRARTKQGFKKSWWLFATLIVGHIAQELLKDRLISGTNKLIDEHTKGVFVFIKPTLLYFVGNPVATLCALCILTVTILVIHAYIETRPVSTPTGESAESPLPLAAPNSQPKLQEERIFVGAEITPVFLACLYRTHTSVQANKLASIYLSKWMHVSGSVSDVRADMWGEKDREVLVHLFHQEKKGDKKPVMILFRFEEKWRERVLMLKQGQKIDAFGRITDIDWRSVVLKQCELE